MAKDSDNVKTNSDVTAAGEPGKSVETVFTQTIFDNSTDSHMNFPKYVHETKSRGEKVLEDFPCPI
jgi:hypothetical protein